MTPITQEESGPHAPGTGAPERGGPPTATRKSSRPHKGIIAALADATRSGLGLWFALTSAEQKAVVVIMALALLGLLVRSWRIARGAL